MTDDKPDYEMIARELFNRLNNFNDCNYDDLNPIAKQQWLYEAGQMYYDYELVKECIGDDDTVSMDYINKIIYKSLNKYSVTEDREGYLQEVAVLSEELGEISRALLDQRECWYSEMREETFDLMVASMKFALALTDHNTSEFVKRMLRSIEKLE